MRFWNLHVNAYGLPKVVHYSAHAMYFYIKFFFEEKKATQEELFALDYFRWI